ncbi:hypothetical protein KKB18_02600 [bacterium]|nr:hypothetical protein [bacterium]
MDFRLEGAVENYLNGLDLVNDCDVISVAGAAKDIVENPEGYVAQQIGLSVKLHDISQLIIFHHTDCGAYGGSDNFSGVDEEREFHATQMRSAKEILQAKYPELKIKMVLGVMEGKNISFEDVE